MSSFRWKTWQSVISAAASFTASSKPYATKTPVEMIRNFRLTRAKEMLEQKAYGIRVAYEVYSNLSQ
jgi:transcriptional regulator GlxA family with amidase domain